MAQPEIRSYNPSWLERSRNAVAQGLLSSGLISDQYRAYNTANSLLGTDPSGQGVMGVADFVPGVSLTKGIAETRDAAARGDYAEAGLLGLSSLVGEVPGVGDALSAMFIGPLARNADKMMLSIAEKMESSGIRPTEIWQKTGWGRGADGKWRTEVSDEASGFKTDIPYDMKMRMAAGDEMRLADIYSNPEVFQAYPQLMDYVVSTDTRSGTRGTFNPILDRIDISPELSGDEARSVMAHEIQHAIQNIESFAQGGSVEQAKQIANVVSDLEGAGLVRSGAHEPLQRSQHLLGHLRGLRPAQTLDRMRNINRPKDLFNSSYWYELSDQVRSQIGPPPKRGSSLPYAQEAGKVIASILEKRPEFSYANQILERDGGKEINRKIRNLEAQWRRVVDSNQFKESQAAVNSYKDRRGLLANETDFDTYERIAGEVEARSTQDRLNWSPQQRRESPNFVTESYPRRYQIPYYLDERLNFEVMPDRNMLDVLYPRGLLAD